MLIGALMPEVEAAALRPLANPKTVIATPTTFYVGAARKMVVQAKEVDSNTRAVLISADDGGTRSYAPAPPWGRQREAGDHAAVTISNGVAHYVDTSGVFPPVDKVIPPDAKVYVLGSGSITA
jgi:hypothetical protein